MKSAITLAITAVMIHWCVCAAFLIARPVEKNGWLDQYETARKEGAMIWSSSAPPLYIAERPLYNWSEWHGGERQWVKAIVGANLFPFYIAATTDRHFQLICLYLDARPSYHQQSWIIGWLFLAVSSAQWFIVGFVVGRSRRQRSNSTLQPTPTRAA